MPDARALLQHARPILSGLGIGLALLGIALDDRRIIWGAIGALGLAFLLRLASRRNARSSSSDSA